MGNLIVTGNKNIIEKDNLAKIRCFIFGDGCFINGRDGCNFGITRTNNSVRIGKGSICAYGYAGYNPNEVVFNFIKANTVQYWFIYAELNMSSFPNNCEIKKVKNGRSETRTFRKDVLSLENSGVYQRELYRIKVENTGITEVLDLRRLGSYIIKYYDYSILLFAPSYVYKKYKFNHITGEFSFNESDKIAIGNIERGKDYYCYDWNDPDNRSRMIGIKEETIFTYWRPIESEKSDIIETKIKPEKVSNCTYANMLVGEIDSNVTAVTQPYGDESNKVATTEFVKTMIANAL